jgi:outer membrane biogenesis lipoprotein LolB
MKTLLLVTASLIFIGCSNTSTLQPNSNWEISGQSVIYTQKSF